MKFVFFVWFLMIGFLLGSLNSDSSSNSNMGVQERRLRLLEAAAGRSSSNTY
jgi:hypothetical protein